MAVQATECYRLVTIGYLKTFIRNGSTTTGDLLIQDSSGNGVDLNLNALAAANRVDSYCPTYGELTGGSLIPNWSQGSRPNLDSDGIVVNTNSLAKSDESSKAYTAAQCVDRGDLSLIYTRFKEFTVSANPTTVSECGADTTISYSHKYTRYTKAMNSNCVVPTPSSSDVSDTTDSIVTLTTNIGTFGSWSNHTKTLTIPKNGTVSASSRTVKVTGSTSFRGSAKTANVNITQSALTGDYTQYVSGRTYVTSIALTNITPSTKAFACPGGDYSASGTSTYDTYTTYSWVDSCGVNYPDLKKEKKTRTGDTKSLGKKSGTLSELNCCDYKTGTNKVVTATLTFTDGDNSASSSVTFTQTCPGCSGEGWTWVEDTSKAKTTAYTITDVSNSGATYGCAGGSKTVNATGTTAITTYYVGQDSCGHIDTSRTSASTATSSASSAKTATFSSIDCCSYKTGTTATSSSALTFTSGNKTSTANFSQSCEGCSGQGTTWEYSSSAASNYNITVTRLTPAVVNSCASSTFSANASYTYTITKTYIRKDDCGNLYPGTTSSTTETGTGSLATQTGTFDEMDCCVGGEYTANLVFTVGGISASTDFVHVCTPCPDDNKCKTYPCSRGTDDGNQPFTHGIKPTATLICWQGSSFASGQDSLYVSDIRINGNPVSTNPSNPTYITDWMRAYRDTVGGVCGSNGPGNIYYEVDPNPASAATLEEANAAARIAEVTFTTTSSTVCAYYSAQTGVATACDTWTGTFKQAPCGWYWCAEDPSQTGHVYRTLRKCGTNCPSTTTNCSSSCACSGTLYTYTVYTNVQYATVSIGGTNYSATVVSGSYYKVTHVTTADTTYTATISKQGCTFPTSSASVSRNGSATLTGSCATCSSCLETNVRDVVVQGSSQGGFPSTGYGGTIITFKASCNSGTYKVEHVSGAMFISSISVSNVGGTQFIITGTVPINTTPYDRTETLAIKYNGVICKTVSVKQKTGTQN